MHDTNSPELPVDLDHIQFSTKSNESWVIFGGLHRIFNPLSNQIVHTKIIHDTLEYAYQYAKASRYQDNAAEEQILCASSPAEAKQIGYHIKNFDSADWDTVKTGIMFELLRIKLATNCTEAYVNILINNAKLLLITL